VYKLLTGGGLGDAMIAMAKFYSRFVLEDCQVTHGVSHRQWINNIQSLYNYQEIKCKVEYTIWREEIETKSKIHDYFLHTTWNAKIHEDEILKYFPEDWEIEPFPPLKYNKRQDVDIVISPVACMEFKRKLNDSSLMKLADRISKTNHITYVGHGRPMNHYPGTSLINKTTIPELVDIICSANVVIGAEGLVTWLGAMADKKVFMQIDNLPGIKRRQHPKWNIALFNDMREVEL